MVLRYFLAVTNQLQRVCHIMGRNGQPLAIEIEQFRKGSFHPPERRFRPGKEQFIAPGDNPALRIIHQFQVFIIFPQDSHHFPIVLKNQLLFQRFWQPDFLLSLLQS